jgi:glycosyltransferase involved in cell wall biosynthesis
MRVLHIIKTADGADWAWKMAGHLVRMGVEVHVALPRLSGRFIGAWASSGAVLHELDASLPVREPWAWSRRVKALRGLVAAVAPDLLHAHFVTNIVFLRLALGASPLPRIFQVPGPLHLEHTASRRIERACADSRDWWVASSRYIRRMYTADGVPEERVFLSYYGSDPQGFLDRRTGELRGELGIPADAFVVGNVNYFYAPKRYLGQTRGLKNHEDVLAAARLLTGGDAPWWVLVGQQWGRSQGYFRRMRARAASIPGHVALPGWRSSAAIKRMWADFDLAVHVPLSENCGGVIEPLMAGVPVIAAAVGGLPEVIVPGVTGDLVPPRDPAALARAIAAVRRDPEAARARALRGQRLVREMFDSSRTAREIHNIYQKVLGLRHAGPTEFDAARAVQE